MQEPLTTIKTTKIASEKGFNWKPNTYFDDGERLLPVPTQSLLQKWLRDKHGIHVKADTDITLSWYWTVYSLHPGVDASYTGLFSDCVYSTYEEALEEGLYKALGVL